MYRQLYPSFNLHLVEPHDHLVHSSPQCDNASEKARHYIEKIKNSGKAVPFLTFCNGLKVTEYLQ